MEAQNLARSHAASLGVTNLEPVPHWPDDNYLEQGQGESDGLMTIEPGVPIRLTLIDALRVAAGNSRDYQSQKENVYRTALALDLERDAFRTTFSGVSSADVSYDSGADPQVAGIDSSTEFGLTQRFTNGLTLSGAIALDVAKLLTQDHSSSNALSADFSVELPLLRGSGRHVVAEPLVQSERDALYAIYRFERFKHTFVVDIASDYLAVLQQLDRIQNEEDNYKGLIITVRQVRRESEAGRQSQIEVDRALQDELQARQRWISAQQSYERSLDGFKLTLGLPVDADIELDRDELERLAQTVRAALPAREDPLAQTEEALPADAPVTLIVPSREGAGPMELQQDIAVDLALKNRLDLRIAQGEVYDAQRSVVIAADALGAELTLLGRAGAGEGRSLSSTGKPDSFDPRFDQGFYDTLLTLDLPLERTRERNAYRNRLIDLQRTVRDFQETEDRVKLDVRNILRDLLESRESLHIQAGAVELAQERVRSTDLLLQAGRGSIRNALDAKDDLVQSQNSLTQALVQYLIAELAIQRDMGVLEVNEQGLWRTYNPKEVPDDNHHNGG
jgi:outer membrane protein TolC